MDTLQLAQAELKGLGLGNSIQKMGYLPEPHTDVIMAVISEELGLIRSNHCYWWSWFYCFTCIINCA